MVGEPFRAALERTGMTAEQFAEVIEVDPKTVQRWLSGRTPYRRHRATIARALDTPAHQLWPDDVPAPEQPAAPSAWPSDEHVEEVMRSLAAQDIEARSSAMVEIVESAERALDILAPWPGMLGHVDTAEVLLRAAGRGCHVRVASLTDEASLPALAKASQHPDIALRVFDSVYVAAIIRGDNQLMLGIGLVGNHNWPFLRLARLRDDGLFDGAVMHFESFWQYAKPYQPAPDTSHEDARDATEATAKSRRVRKWQD